MKPPESTAKLEQSRECWRSASDGTNFILRAGDSAQTSSAVEHSSRMRPEHAMQSTSQFLEQMRLERALLNLERHTAGRSLTRSERRLHDHLQWRLQALTEQENHD